MSTGCFLVILIQGQVCGEDIEVRPIGPALQGIVKPVLRSCIILEIQVQQDEAPTQPRVARIQLDGFLHQRHGFRKPIARVGLEGRKRLVGPRIRGMNFDQAAEQRFCLVQPPRGRE